MDYKEWPEFNIQMNCFIDRGYTAVAGTLTNLYGQRYSLYTGRYVILRDTLADM